MAGNKVTKILPYVILTSAALSIFAFVAKGMKLITFGQNAKWDIDKVSGINIKGGFPNGYLFVLIDIFVDNTSDTVVNVKKPYIQAYLDGKPIGSTIPSPDIIEIQPNNRTIIKDIEVRMPVTKVIPLIPDIVNLILHGGKLGKKLRLDIDLEIEGHKVSKQINIDV